MKIRALAVFCGSKYGNNTIYKNDAKLVGEIAAQNDITVIYGGGGVGIMKEVADATMHNGGKVIGIIKGQFQLFQSFCSVADYSSY